MRIPKIVKEVGKKIIQAGFQCYLVGGAVRNMVASCKVTDYDLATDAPPETVMQLFKKVIPTGIKHGTVTVLYKGEKFEVTTFRIEGLYSDSRRPDTISFTPSILEDLKRRDFTINAIAIDISTEKLLDPHRGIQDIKQGLIRAIGDPEKRFSEDALRMLRACRFAAQLDFTVEESTIEGIRSRHTFIASVSSERIRDEFIKILETEKPSKGIAIMDSTGLLRIILPELYECKGVEQKGFHKFDVYTHSLLSCDMAEPTLIIRLSALFHDIGKPRALSISPEGERTFYRHEEYSSEIATTILERLRFPKIVIQTVSHLIRHHMFNYESNWTDAAIRRFISRVGKDNLKPLFKLRVADQHGISGEVHPNHNLQTLEERIEDIIQKDHAFSVKDLAVNGDDLAEDAHIPRGPEMGIVLQLLLEAVLDDPAMNNRDALLRLAKNYYEEYLDI